VPRESVGKGRVKEKHSDFGGGEDRNVRRRLGQKKKWAELSQTTRRGEKSTRRGSMCCNIVKWAFSKDLTTRRYGGRRVSFLGCGLPQGLQDKKKRERAAPWRKREAGATIKNRGCKKRCRKSPARRKVTKSNDDASGRCSCADYNEKTF